MTTTNSSKRTDVRRSLIGTVTSNAMAKTIVVRVERMVQHRKYGKIYMVSKKYKAHDAEGKARLGDVVEIQETRPLSADKRWRYIKTITENK